MAAAPWLLVFLFSYLCNFGFCANPQAGILSGSIVSSKYNALAAELAQGRLPDFHLLHNSVVLIIVLPEYARQLSARMFPSTIIVLVNIPRSYPAGFSPCAA